ncbi:MAG: cardiolipin synthase [Treponema sp.]|jgi:cardiolipin synthase|nr:cardiolipin synthase [Treponema sp.]
MAGINKPWVRVVFRRRVFVISILLVQILFITFLIAGGSLYFRYLSIFLSFLSIIVCIRIINRKEKPAYKLTWIFIILLFPIFGGILYVLFYTQSNPRKLKKQIAEVDRLAASSFSLPGNRLPALLSNNREFYTLAHYLQEYAGFPVYSKTRTEYFPSGESFYKRVMEEIVKAERYIFLEFFILRQGQMLDPVLSILEEKACKGVDVRVIYDDLGCFMSLPPDFKNYLWQRGIKCQIFNPFKPIFSSLQNNRDHRKLIIIDGKTAFTGGINLADEYINAIERFGHWKDAAIMLQGEGAWSLTMIFLCMWNLGLKEKEKFDSFYPWPGMPTELENAGAEAPVRGSPPDGECGIESDGFVQPYADSPIDDENVGEHVYIQIINNAREYVYINTPYLVVDDNLLSALTLAAKSGVDVRIITPHRWDKWMVAITSRSYYRQLVTAGVKVYEYTSGFNHSKTFVCDDKIATVGTTNLDFRSLYLHFECGVVVYRSKSIRSVKEDFLDTLPGCHRITISDCARNALQRMIQDVLRLFAPLM